MTTHDNAPPPPEWRPEPRALRLLPDGCAGCGVSTVACEAAEYVKGQACCGGCGHD